jgi:hypothetical protein
MRTHFVLFMYEVFTIIEPCVFLSGFELTFCSKVVLGCSYNRSEIHHGHRRSVPLHFLNLQKPIWLYSSSFGICSDSFCSPSYNVTLYVLVSKPQFQWHRQLRVAYYNNPPFFLWKLRNYGWCNPCLPLNLMKVWWAMTVQHRNQCACLGWG